MKAVLITGNTYPVKDRLRALGGKWEPTAKGWYVPYEKAAEAQQLVANTPKPTAPQRRPSAGRRTGCSCGSREDTSGQLIPNSRNCNQCEFDDE